MCDEAINTPKNSSEEVFIEMIVKEHEEYEKRFKELFAECYSRLLENKIVVINNEVFNNHFSKLEFVNKLEDLNKEDDFINSCTRVNTRLSR